MVSKNFKLFSEVLMSSIMISHLHLSISRLCCYEENFIKNKANMKSRFLKREYPEKLILAEMDKVTLRSLIDVPPL